MGESDKHFLLKEARFIKISLKTKFFKNIFPTKKSEIFCKKLTVSHDIENKLQSITRRKY